MYFYFLYIYIYMIQLARCLTGAKRATHVLMPTYRIAVVVLAI